MAADANGSLEVDSFMAGQNHPMDAAITRLRAAFLASTPGLSEHVKWNAPSFVYDGEDRVTFTLHPPTKLRLVLHRGAKVRADADAFVFADRWNLITWSTGDRGVISFGSAEDALAREDDLVALVQEWVQA